MTLLIDVYKRQGIAKIKICAAKKCIIVNHIFNNKLFALIYLFIVSKYKANLFIVLIKIDVYKRQDIKRVLLSAVIAAVHGIILVASRDLGAALIFLSLIHIYMCIRDSVVPS